MPRLIFAVACQRAITSQEGVVSLIDVVERMVVHGAPELGDRSQHQVTLVTHWRLTPEDRGREYELRVGIYLPDGKLDHERIGPPFRINEEFLSHRYLFHIQDFPLWQQGTYQIRVSIREAGADMRWRTVAKYPVEVVHNPLEANESPPH